MTKHYRTAGLDYRVVEINGRPFKLRPLTLGVYAELEAYIISQRPDPLAIAGEAVKKLPANQHDAVWKAAMAHAVTARTVTSEQAAAFEDSVDGLAWKLWQCLKADQPEFDSLESVRALMIQAGEAKFEELARAAEIASGEADLKKSSGQAEAETVTAPVGL